TSVAPHMDTLQFAYQPNISVDDALIYMLHRTYTHLDTPDASAAVCGSAELHFRYHPEQHRGTTGNSAGTVPLYTIYTVDFQHNTSNCFLQKFSDNTAVVGLIREDEEEEYKKTIKEFVNWSEHNHLILNTTKTKEVIVDFRKRRRRRDQPTPISIRGTEVEVVSSHRYLGVQLDEKLDWSKPHGVCVPQRAESTVLLEAAAVIQYLSPPAPECVSYGGRQCPVFCSGLLGRGPSHCRQEQAG
ncbi:hypothetical protein L3Q82_025539, partial [Scortum barcoo]